MVAAQTEMQLTVRMIADSATTNVPARLRYDAADPYAVTLSFDGESNGPIDWIFARDLLVVGMTTATGDGDVRIWPAETGNQVFIRLSSPSGQGLLAAALGRVSAFIVQTVLLVPVGAEPALLDVDEALYLLLDSDPGIAPA